MMQGLHFTDEAPFADVFIHGLVRDGQGQKMSKTKGNVIDPLELISEYGADALRLALMSQCGPGQDIRFSDSSVHAAKLFVTKLWNSARFSRINEAVYDPNFDPATATHPANRWIARATATTALSFFEDLERYRFDHACSELQAFVRDIFSDWYIELSKIDLETADEATQVEIRKTMGWCVANICHMLNPFVPYVTESIWDHIGAPGSIVSTDFPDYQALLNSVDATEEIDRTIALISRIRSTRDQFNVPRKASVTLNLITGDAGVAGGVEAYAPHLSRLSGIATIARADALASGQVPVNVTGLDAAIDIGEIVDLDQELKRLAGAAEKMRKELGKLEGRLSNAAYIERAAPEAVQKSREQRDALAADIQRLDEALSLTKGA